MDRTALADRPRVLVIGAGFAGYHCLRRLERRLPAAAAEVIAVSSADYMLYVPLLPDVTGGVLEPHRVAVPLRTRLPRTRLVLGTVTSLSLDDRTCSVEDIAGRRRLVSYDRLVIACGSVTRLLAVPGVAENALGFKSVAEALYLRDHVLRQLELAGQCDDDDERAARLTLILAAGDIAAVPDLTRPGMVTAMTAQHAQRQGKLAADNTAASLGRGQPRAYKHHNLGFVVDLGGWEAVANPLGVRLSGPAAKAVTRGYHLYALPGGRLRVATDWIDGSLSRPPMVQFGLVPEPRLRP